MDLRVFLEPTVDLARVTAILDGLGHRGRVATVRGWERPQLAALYEAAKAYRPLALDHFVPSAVGAMTEVVHHGKNSLPLFSQFQKRFARPEGAAEPPQLVGFNRQANEAFTGPGYFVVHDGDVAGEIAIDYRQTPRSKVASWPAIVPNSAKLGRFVYAGMVDVMRGISGHVSIGRAWKAGRAMDAWFVLCREDVS